MCNKNKIIYIYIYTGNNKNDRKVIASSSSVPVFCLTLHATSTFCAVRWGTRHSMCQKSGPTAALAETGAMFLIGLWVSSHIGHIWHDAKDLSFSASVKGIPIRNVFFFSFFLEGEHPLISLFRCYFTLRIISTICTTFGRRRVIKEPASW